MPLLTVLDQADALPTEQSWLGWGPGSIPTNGNIFLSLSSIHNITRSDRIGFTTKNSNKIVGLFRFRCTWLGRQCDVDVSFETILTDLGVCYTFNNNNNNNNSDLTSLTVTESGQINYLSLTMSKIRNKRNLSS